MVSVPSQCQQRGVVLGSVVVHPGSMGKRLIRSDNGRSGASVTKEKSDLSCTSRRFNIGFMASSSLMDVRVGDGLRDTS